MSLIEWQQTPRSDERGAGFKRNGITWIASWPKSGNTWIRLFLSAYLKGPENFSLTSTNIEGDSQVHFHQMMSPVPLQDMSVGDRLRVRDAALAAHYTTSKKTNLLLKTHHANVAINDRRLIPIDLTSKAICLIRDPRDVLVSWKRYSDKSWQEAFENFSEETTYLYDANSVPSFISSWVNHTKSWAYEDRFPIGWVKYEELLREPEVGFRKLLEFLEMDFIEDRFQECMRLTTLAKLKKLEKQTGFIDNGPNGAFFHKGGSRWQQELPKKYARQVADECAEIMEFFGYE